MFLSLSRRVPSSPLIAGLALLAALLDLAGCQAARMEVPPEVRAQAAEMPVRGRQVLGLDSDITFGPYAARGIQRGWTETTTRGAWWGNLDYSQVSASQRYEFSMLAPGTPPLRCRCASGVDQQMLDVYLGRGGELSIQMAGRDNLVCAAEEGPGQPVWRLALGRGASQAVYHGTVTGGGGIHQVRGSQRLAGTPMPLTEASGYEFLAMGRPVGAVEVLNEGAVWLPGGLSPAARRDLAAAAAALLLHQQIGRR